jgi:hypothetical protein
VPAQQPASSESSAVQALSQASRRLLRALQSNSTAACDAEQFLEIMEPAQSLAELLPGKEDVSTPLAPELLL